MHKEPITLVIIPSTKAAHCYDETAHELAHGDLALLMLPAEGATSAALVLKIGPKVAFLLKRETPFGTLADHTNVYVFAPAGITG